MGLQVVPEPDRVWMKKDAVARYLSVSERTIDKWRALEAFPCWKHRNMVRFERGEVDEWVARRFAQTASRG